MNAESKPATQYTIDANQQVYALLDFADTTELENANRGFLAAPDTLDLRDEEGRAVWTQDAYAFLDKDAPDTANPLGTAAGSQRGSQYARHKEHTHLFFLHRRSFHVRKGFPAGLSRGG